MNKIQKNINSLPHNWLIHHIYINSLKNNLEYIKGKVIDVGCGKKPFSDIITQKCYKYIGLEYKKTLHGFSKVDVIGNALNLPFQNSIADTVVSFQTMEHVYKPEIFLEEIYRILKPNGYCLLMTPFIWGEHEVPYDYFRYTKFGLKYLAENAGFKVVHIIADTNHFTTSIIRFNYFLMNYFRGILKLFLIPFFWCTQYLALLGEKIIKNLGNETANYTTVLQKSN